MISFVIPAHNEQALIRQTLAAIRRSAATVGEPFEIIVVDDASTDRTAALAGADGARVVRVNLRKISAVRNAGAREAHGDRLIFVDADTLIDEGILRAAMTALDMGYVGGGALVAMEGKIGYSAKALLAFWVLLARVFHWAAGCFIFVRRDVFDAIGGFDEQLYISEELTFSQAMKKHGRIAILRDRVVTSGRKVRMYPMRRVWGLLLRFAIRGPRMHRSREGLEMWYEGRREDPPADQ